MLCVGQQLAYCVYLVALFHVLFCAVNVYVFYEQINDDDIWRQLLASGSATVRVALSSGAVTGVYC